MKKRLRYFDMAAMARLSSRNFTFLPYSSCTWYRRSSSVIVACQKMHVPGFGGKSPEAQAATSLRNFFTYLAVKIVLAQLEDYNREAYEDLVKFTNKVPLKDGDKFCCALMRESSRHKTLALRILEVRLAYASEDFEWDNVRRLSLQQMDKSNMTMMREFLTETTGIE